MDQRRRSRSPRRRARAGRPPRRSSRTPACRQAAIAAASVTTAVPWTSSCITGWGSASISAPLDLEAVRRRDVLEVDPAEAGRDRARPSRRTRRTSSRVDQDRHGAEADALRVEQRLALHHRHRGDRADVAEAEHARAVGADRDRCARSSCSAPPAPGPRRSPGTRARRPGCRRRACPGWCGSGARLDVAACRRRGASSARSVVPDHRHARQRAERGGDRVGVLRVAHLDRDLAQRVLAPEGDRRHVADQPPVVGDHAADRGQLTRAVRDLKPVGAVQHTRQTTSWGRSDSVRPHARHPLGSDHPVRRRAAGRSRAADPAAPRPPATTTSGAPRPTVPTASPRSRWPPPGPSARAC